MRASPARLLDSPAGSDGVLAPLRPEVAAAAEGTHVQITGVQGTQPDAAELARAEEQPSSGDEPTGAAAPEEDVEDAVAEAEAGRPSRRASPGDDHVSSAASRYEAPAVDSYSLRLIAHAQALRQRHARPALTVARWTRRRAAGCCVNPHDLERLGVDRRRRGQGSRRRATTVDYAAHASDAVPRGTALMTFNQPGADPAVLIDATAAVTDIRVEVRLMDPLFAAGSVGERRRSSCIIKVVVVFVFLLIATMLMVWFERKVIGDMQNRIGPNRAGPWGILQTLADGIKLFFKEPLIPDRADRRIFRLAPYLSFVPAFLVFSIVPVRRRVRERPGRHGHDPRPRDVPATGQPADRDPRRARRCRRSRSTA